MLTLHPTITRSSSLFVVAADYGFLGSFDERDCVVQMRPIVRKQEYSDELGVGSIC